MRAKGSMKKELLEKLFTAIKQYSYRENLETPFTLASGKKSPWYFDLKKILLRPAILQLVGQLFCEKMHERFNEYPAAMAGLTMGSDPIIYAAVLYAYQNEKTIFPLVIRKEAKDHGSGKQIEGLLSEVNGNIVLIDDVITTGMSTLKALDALEREGKSSVEAFCLLDRMEGGAANLAKRGVHLNALFTLDDFRR